MLDHKLYPSTILNPVLEILVYNAKKDPQISGLALTKAPDYVGANMGLSTGLILIAKDKANIPDINSAILDKIYPHITFQLEYKYPLRVVLYLGEECLKLELKYTTDLKSFEESITSSTYVLYDQDGSLTDILREWRPGLESKEDMIYDKVQDFLFAFEAFSNAHRISDGYQAYYYYGLALQELVELISILRRDKKTEFTSPPDFFATKYLSRDEQIQFRHLGGSIRLKDMNEAKLRLKHAFDRILIEAEARLGSRLSVDKIKSFCDKIYRRDYFWNLRDLARFNPAKIRKNMILRSATLHNYIADPYFIEWIDKTGIKAIINLQTNLEIQKRPYSEDFMSKVRYYQIPLIPGVGLDKDGPNLESEIDIAFEDLYVWVLENRKEQIRDLFAILANPENYPLIIHCYGGKDRTGIIIALLHLLLGSEEVNIILDYLISAPEMDSIYIRSLLDFISNQGGIHEFLRSVGISPEELSIITDSILIPISNAD
ncbi:MAG: tyrosine-protein phosphatase [Candidatus Heimdallarchaeota archaeon]